MGGSLRAAAAAQGVGSKPQAAGMHHQAEPLQCPSLRPLPASVAANARPLHPLPAAPLHPPSLEEVAGEDELQAAKGGLQAPDLAAHRLEQVEELGGHHAHLVNHQRLRGRQQQQ